jgi:hypothetical protein
VSERWPIELRFSLPRGIDEEQGERCLAGINELFALADRVDDAEFPHLLTLSMVMHYKAHYGDADVQWLKRFVDRAIDEYYDVVEVVADGGGVH